MAESISDKQDKVLSQDGINISVKQENILMETIIFTTLLINMARKTLK
jgi:hypothetical protein